MKQQEEVWKDVSGYEGLYKISNYGRVMIMSRFQDKGRFSHFSKQRTKLQFKNQRGYLRIGLIKNGKNKNFSVHRLVAEAFIPNPENKEQINHIDGNKENNHTSNLEWCTGKENCTHAFKNGLNWCRNKGRINLINKRTKQVIQLNDFGQLINVFNSIRQAGINTGVNDSLIHRCMNGKRKHAGGFVWKYANIKNYEKR